MIINFQIIIKVDMDINENGRNRILSEWIKKVPPNSKILDAGAGELKWKKACSHLQYISQDICQYDGTGKEGLQTGKWDTSKIDIVSDIIDIPVSDGEFDAVLCSEVLEHISHPEKAIEEFSRIIRKDGLLILSAPFNSLTHFAPYHYCTGFSKYWFETVLSEHGFEIIDIRPNGDYFTYLIQENRRLACVYNKYYRKKSFLLFSVSNILAKLLEIKTIKKNASYELGCFGWLVLARKG